MNEPLQENTTPAQKIQPRWQIVLINTIYIAAALLIFLFTLDLMIASLQHIGQDATAIITLATSNPFTGLFIGLLITAMIQSSSATTSMIVALVASGAISLDGAIPILMGANVGTTITSTIVSLGFITKKKEFRRAVTIGTYHDFFNILTVLILFPLEYYFGFLSGFAHLIATSFFNEPIAKAQREFSLLGPGFSPLVEFIVDFIDNGFLLIVLSIALLFGSILFFRKVLSKTLGFGSQERFQQFFFKNSLKSFIWGLLTTAAIRSSTVTTSLVVPLVAKKVVKIKDAYPFILGANIGTTITAFLAALFNSNAAISIAIAHFLFNLIGVLIFFPLPFINQLPVKLAEWLGRLTLRYRLVGFLYLLLTFFFIPFTLIYFNKDTVQVQELKFIQEDVSNHTTNTYTLISKKYLNQPITNWLQSEPAETKMRDSLATQTIYRRKNLMLIDNELFELNKPGFCRDDEDKFGKFKTCIIDVIPTYQVGPTLFIDSVYVFEKKWYEPQQNDSLVMKMYVSATENLLIKKEKYTSQGKLKWQETLLDIIKK